MHFLNFICDEEYHSSYNVKKKKILRLKIKWFDIDCHVVKFIHCKNEGVVRISCDEWTVLQEIHWVLLN